MPLKNKNHLKDEIDLLEVILIIWNGKFKIIFITLFGLFSIYFYQKTQPVNYLSLTEIRPISIFDESKYITFNSYIELKYNSKLKYNSSKTSKNKKKLNQKKDILKFTNIERYYLLSLFIEKVSDRALLKKAVKELGLIKKENYSSQQNYEDAITIFLSGIKLLPPNQNKKKGLVSDYWNLQFNISNRDKWTKILEYIEKPINLEIKLFLNKIFKDLIQNERQLIEFEIEDVDIRINNSIKNYETEVKYRLLFLDEQAKIARELGVAKNNVMDSQRFTTETGVIANIKAEVQYYMRGYEMIEKEIELINNRTDKKAFTDGLNILEGKKRSLIAKKDNDIRRLENLFLQTPIVLQPNKFYAAKIMAKSTKYKLSGLPLAKKLLITTIISAFIGLVYVLFSHAIQNNRN